jgi:hypothetical protein
MNGNSINDIGGLAAVINSRLSAEARMAKAIAFAWLCGGSAIALSLSGLGLAFAFYGYSYMLSVAPAAEQTAKALVAALERANFKTTVSGKMSLSPGSELSLAPGQTIRLGEGAIVKLDPSSSVRVVGDLKIDMPQPSKQQLQLDTTSHSAEIPFTNYTIFKAVEYASGEVVTGWNFDLSDTIRPKIQYCYYSQNVEKGLTARQILAVNDSPLRPSALAKLKFDFDGALANCIWFSGS